MRRFFLRLRLFSLLFETAGPPSMATLTRSALTLSVWIGLSVLTPLSSETSFGLVVLAWFVSGHVLRLGTRSRQVGRDKGWPSPRYLAVTFAGIAGVAVVSPNPFWVQHLVTFVFVMQAIGCLADMLDGEDTFGRFWWPSEHMDHARSALTRVFFLKHIAFALLNETFAATCPPEGWLVWLAILPVVDHYVNSALTTTVLLDAEESH